MRVTALLLIVFCIHACEENVRKKEFELYSRFHLENGLCVAKYLNPSNSEGKPEWNIRLYSCPDSIPKKNTPLTEENIMKHKQGGLCFYKNCDIEPEESFTMFMKKPKGFIDSNEYEVFASKISNSGMLYEYTENDSVSSDEGYKYIKHLKDWKELFSMAKPLKINNENLSDGCNSKSCSTKDFLTQPSHKITCDYGIKQKRIACRRERIRPKCLSRLKSLSNEYGILMHSGAFPVEDCDLGNWRYIKINNLGKEHYEKLKTLLRAN